MSNSGKIWDVRESYKKQRANAWSKGQLGLFSGGSTPSEIATIQSVIPATAGNTVDFGDLHATESNHSGFGNFTIAIFGGGEPLTNNLEYLQFATKGNAADFGDMTLARAAMGASSNNIRGLIGGGEDPCF